MMTVGIVGAILIKISFVAALVAAFLYYRNQNVVVLGGIALARNSYHLSVLGLVSAASILLYLILTHQFQYAYVWNYSSSDLPLSLLISSFYAGQEGSFTLWALFTALIGLFLLQYSARKGYEPYVMSIYSLIVSFLMLMLVVKNPFAFIWEAFPSDLVQSGPIPPGTSNIVMLDEARQIWARYPLEGKGLNPLLQNYWMVIHPQILFVGFAAMAVPYAHAVAALMKRDYTSWIRPATPWLVFGSMMLGAGIILGGYWAYETLGWGGFWGWDPVENSSLVPWLLSVAAIHTTLIQRKSGAYVKTNFFLSMLTFLAVLYSTFLTRSGVLGETSVHSFVDPGMWVYWLLLGCLALFASIGVGLLLLRRREMPTVQIEYSVYSREFAIFLGAMALVFVALFVTIGTSSPIITTILKGKASAVEMNYYVQTNLPLGIAIALLSGIGQLLWWRSSQSPSFLKSLALPAALAIITTVAVLFFGSEEPMILLFTFCSAFSLFANLRLGYSIYMGNPKYAGGVLAHIGIAIMFLGFVTSERYDETRTLSLARGKTVEALGYRVTYLGYEPTEREKYAFNVEVEREGKKHIVSPTMYHSEFTRGLMRHPDLLNFLSRDLYVAPLSLEESEDGRERRFELSKGTDVAEAGLRIAFEDFDLSNMDKTSAAEGGAFQLGVRLSVDEPTGQHKKKLTLLMINSRAGEPRFPIVPYTSSQQRLYEFRLVRIAPDQENPTNSRVEIAMTIPAEIPGEGKAETLVVEASVKPLINLVWLGTVTLLVGFVVTITRRVREARLGSIVQE
ncbi:MAG: hypothetical protein FJ215_13050 [Ignavibacteria bacterium]|nr:hypothetical protein [Ignavibacteria bacterium]